MRGMMFTTFGAALAVGGGLLMAAGAAAHPGGEAGTVQYRATATYSDGTSADRLYVVRTDADSDGDGIGDETYLRVRCDGGAMAAVYHTVKSPRDAASGQASGKRMHKPFTITKVVDSSSPLFGRIGGGGGKVSWDLKENKGARAGSATYDVKKVEGTGARTGAGYDVKKVEGTGAKTMAHDDWHEVTLAAGAPDLCD